MFNQEIQEYLDYKVAMGKCVASMRYKPHLMKFSAAMKGSLKDTKASDITRFMEGLRLKYAPNTVYLALTGIKNFLKYMKVSGRKCIDPSILGGLKMPARSYKALSLDEFHKIDNLIGTDTFNELEKKLAFRMMYETGVRVSELAGLQISQIDSKNAWTVIHTKKNRKPRTIMWGEKTHNLLLRYLGVRICINQRPALFISYGKGADKDQVSVRTIERWVKELCKRAGVNSISPHSLRHGWAHLRRDRGASLPFISEGLGHSSIMSTMIYQQYSNKEFREEAIKHFV